MSNFPHEPSNLAAPRPTSELAADVEVRRTSSNLRLIADEMEAAGFNVPASVATIRRAADQTDALVARVTDLEAQVATLEAGRMDLARLGEEQLARAVAAEAQVAALIAELEGENYILRSTHDARAAQ